MGTKGGRNVELLIAVGTVGATALAVTDRSFDEYIEDIKIPDYVQAKMQEKGIYVWTGVVKITRKSQSQWTGVSRRATLEDLIRYGLTEIRHSTFCVESDLSLKELNERYINHVLGMQHGNKASTARQLKISTKTVYNHIMTDINQNDNGDVSDDGNGDSNGGDDNGISDNGGVNRDDDKSIKLSGLPVEQGVEV